MANVLAVTGTVALLCFYLPYLGLMRIGRMTDKQLWRASVGLKIGLAVISLLVLIFGGEYTVAGTTVIAFVSLMVSLLALSAVGGGAAPVSEEGSWVIRFFLRFLLIVVMLIGLSAIIVINV